MPIKVIFLIISNMLHVNISHIFIHKYLQIFDILLFTNQPCNQDTVQALEIPAGSDPFKTYLSSIPSILPLKNLDKNFLISSFYNKRIHPLKQTLKMHYGIDISAPIGTPVYATADGVVERLYENTNGIGYAIKIQHQYHYSTLYGHLITNPNFEVGQTIKRGQIIAYVGNTGLSTAPHLHYCIYYKSKPINPYNYLNLTSLPSKQKNKSSIFPLK